MDRNNEDAVALIDLGAASIETQGNQGLEIDFVSTQKALGLSDED
jgi:hypothetical protein